SSTGTADINVSHSSVFSSFRKSSVLGDSLFANELRTVAVERVQTRRLDELFVEIVRGIRDPRVYLKLDTQGWDLEVLAGAAGCVGRVVAPQSAMSVGPLYEGMPTQQDAIAAFRRVGFDVVGMFGLWPSPDRRLLEFDCVMVRRPAPQTACQPAIRGP